MVGADAKIGYAAGAFMPYAKIGVNHIMGNDDSDGHSGTGAHYGVGAEYRIHPSATVGLEWTYGQAEDEGSDLSNSNVTLGLNYYLDQPEAQPEPAPVVAPAPAPAPSPVMEALTSQRPVTLPGTNFDFDSAKLRRITSYNVCYTKLLRMREGAGSRAPATARTAKRLGGNVAVLRGRPVAPDARTTFPALSRTGWPVFPYQSSTCHHQTPTKV